MTDMEHKEHKAAPQGGPRKRLRRRGFLMTMGAGGLAAAEVLFGNAPKAAAASCGCCGLTVCPPNTSYSHCRSVRNYTWVCSPGGNATCACCEVKPYNNPSAYYCWAQ